MAAYIQVEQHERVILMGHYASEMAGQRQETEAEKVRRQRAQDLANRGYVFAVPHQNSIGGQSRVWSGPYWNTEGKELLDHKPCGQAVFDEEIHQNFCPANQG
jgi:hypothetical protein